MPRCSRAAWRALRPDAPAPAAIEVLVRKKKSTVCRLRGPGDAGFPVIAKRARTRSAQVERTLHERILPRLAVARLAWHGMVDEEPEGCSWLFLDMSKNRSRRWCDMKVCGNRAKARRFSARYRA